MRSWSVSPDGWGGWSPRQLLLFSKHSSIPSLNSRSPLNLLTALRTGLSGLWGNPWLLTGQLITVTRPLTFLHIPDFTFLTCGLIIRKGEYIREISQCIIAGTLDPDRFKIYPDTGSIVNELVKIRGVGRWTAELTCHRGLHRSDAFPADDVGVRRFISQFYLKGKKTLSVEARAIAERWAPGKDLTHITSKSQTCSESTPKTPKKYEKHSSTNGNGAVESLCLYSDGNLW